MIGLGLVVASLLYWSCDSRSEAPQPPRLRGLSLKLIDRAGCPNSGGVSAARYTLSFDYNGPQGFDADSLILLLVVQAQGRAIDSIQFYNVKLRAWKSRSFPYTRDGNAFSLELCLWHNSQAFLDIVGTFLRPDGTPLIENRLFYGQGGPPELSSFRLQVPNPRQPFQLTDLRYTILTLNDVADPLGGDFYTNAQVEVSWQGEEAEFLTGLSYVELSGQYIEEGGSGGGGGRLIAYFNAGTPQRVENLPEVQPMFRQSNRTAHRMNYPLRFGPSAVVAFDLSARMVSTVELPRSPRSRLPATAYFGVPTSDTYSLTSLPLITRIARPDGAN
jgi:hypothetical protein